MARTGIHYDDPEPILTDKEVRELQDWWDMEDHHIMPPAVPEGSWALWTAPLGLFVLATLWALVGGLLINYFTTGRAW